MLPDYDMPALTPELKVKLYLAKKYKVEVPAVCSSRWAQSDWINAIDSCHGWQRGKHESCRVQYARGYLDGQGKAPFGMSNEAGTQHPDFDEAYRLGFEHGRGRKLSK